MANFKHYFDSRFAGCRILAHAYDQHRNRDVTIYQLPGYVDCVGVSDTVDRWIAPVAPNLFSVDIYQLFRDLHDGKDVKLPLRAGKPGEGQKRARRALIEDDAVVAPPTEPEPVLRRPSKSESQSRRRILI